MTRTIELRRLGAVWDIPTLQRLWNSVTHDYDANPFDPPPTGLTPRRLYLSASDETAYCNLLAGQRHRVADGEGGGFNGCPLTVVRGWPTGILGFVCEQE